MGLHSFGDGQFLEGTLSLREGWADGSPARVDGYVGLTNAFNLRSVPVSLACNSFRGPGQAVQSINQLEDQSRDAYIVLSLISCRSPNLILRFLQVLLAPFVASSADHGSFTRDYALRF